MTIQKPMLMSVLLVLLALPAAAEEQPQATLARLTDKVKQAYGGERLRNLENVTIQRRSMAFTLGQSWQPDLEEQAATAAHLIIDLQTGAMLNEGLFSGRGGVNQSAQVSDGDTTWNINHADQTWGVAAQADYYALAGGLLRTSDTLLARELLKVQDKATLLGETSFQNRAHLRVKIPFPSSPDLTLYIDKETGFISRMVRDNPQLGRLDYVFADRTTSAGLSYARRADFYIDGKPNLITLRNETTFNRALPAQTFALPEGYVEERTRTNTTEMTLARLGDTVFHVGQGAGYSLFVQSSAGLVAMGGTAGFAGRLAYYRKQTDDHRPVSFQLVTHHHYDHVAGLADAVAAGATLVADASHVAAVSKFGKVGGAAFLEAGDRLSLGSGRDRVEIFGVSTIHSARLLIAYVPRTKTLFVADHLFSFYETGVPTAGPGTVSLAAALAPLELDFNKVATVHNARIFTRRDLTQSVAAFEPGACLAERPVCAP